MKRIISVLLVSLLLLTSCSNTKTPEKIKISVLKGPTAIGIVNMLDNPDYTCDFHGAADEISTKLLKGETDIAAVPCNLAAILNNKTNGEIVTLAVNTLGVLYILGKGSDSALTDIKQLFGKTIYTTGQGTTPEYTLKFLLKSAGLNPDTDVTIRYFSESNEVLSNASLEKDAIVMLPQPFANVALNEANGFKILFDVTGEWQRLGDKPLITGVYVTRKTFAKENPSAIENFLANYRESAKAAVSDIDKTAALLSQYDILKEEQAKKAIPFCNVTCITGDNMKEKVLSYLDVLYEQNPASVGGKAPSADLFY